MIREHFLSWTASSWKPTQVEPVLRQLLMYKLVSVLHYQAFQQQVDHTLLSMSIDLEPWRDSVYRVIGQQMSGSTVSSFILDLWLLDSTLRHAAIVPKYEDA